MNIARDRLAISQESLHIQQRDYNQKLSDQQAKCLQLFRLTKSTEDATYEWYKDRIAGRVEGTCMWFLNHPYFREWQQKESGPLLVSADPGCGKSVLAKYLVDHVLPESSTVCYFFFKDQVQNTVREALCALLHQLFSQKQSLLVHAIKQYDKDGAGLVKSTSSLWCVLEDAVQDANAGSVTIVLDALDECAESEVRDLLRHIETQVRNSGSNNAKLKLLMTSRPYEHVVSELYSLSKVFPRIRIPGEDESETISQEVNCVIRHRVKHFGEEKRLSNQIKTCLEDQLVKMEHRTYLWVYLVFDYLDDTHFKKTPKGMASIFNALPKNVHQAYEQILNKSKDRLTVQKVLAIILSASRPLTLAEMNVAIEVDAKTRSVADLDLEQEDDFKSRLRSWCGLFVSVYRGRVYFLHQTAREFLLTERSSSTTIQNGLVWHGFTTMKDAHTALAESCVRFLSFFNDEDGLASNQVKHSKNDAFLEYSAEFWGLHIRESKLCDEGDAALTPFTFKLSDPGVNVYRMWSRIYWRKRYPRDPRFHTRLMVSCHFGHVAVVKRSLKENEDVNALGGFYGSALQTASHGGHEQIVKLLLNKGADVNAQGGYYGNALQAASYGGYEQIVELLLDMGADVNAQGGRYGNALQAASSEGHEQIIELLLNEGADVNAQGGAYGTALQAASYGGYEQMVKILLNKGADVSGFYGSALQSASYGGNEQIVKLLLNKGTDVNAQGGSYRNALQAASLGGNEQIVKLLLNEGADVHAQGGQYGNALQAASHGGHEQIVKLLLNKGADVNAQGGYYGNALQAASYGGYEQIVKLLLDTGADVNAQGGSYGNALQAALYGGYKQIVKLLLDEGADVNAQGGYYGNALQAASPRGDEQIVELLLDMGADVNAQGGHYGNALQAASSEGHEQIIKLLLLKGADVNAQGGSHGNALQAASYGGYEQIVKLLLDKGADFNAQGESFGTPLQAASRSGHEQLVKLLFNAGADVNAQGGYYGNTLQAASNKGYKQIVELLLDMGADVNAQGGHYGNALQAASSEGHEQIIKLLLLKGADVNAQGGYYGNALQVASNKGYKQIVELLLDVGADVNAQGGYYGNAFQAASYGGHTVVVKLLLEKGVNINAQSGRYGNALHAAAYTGNRTVLALLISEVSIMQLQDPYDRTLLWWAAAGGQASTVQVLISQYNYDSRVADKFGRTPFWIATKKGHHAVSELLSNDYIPTVHEQMAPPSHGDAPGSLECDVCTSSITTTDLHYHCRQCFNGDWDVCEDCKSRGAFCAERTHILVKRTWGDMKWVEMTHEM
jgi:ankyrin repeat protein